MATNTFGQLVQSIRESKGYSVRKLAELSGVSQSYLSEIEGGDGKVPSPQVVKNLAWALEADYYHLMEAADYVTLPKVGGMRKFITAKLKPNDDETKPAMNEWTKDNDLELILSNEKISYKGFSLNTEERRRILEMIRLLFPDKNVKSS